MRITLCKLGVHNYVTKASWVRCSRCWRKPPTAAKLAPKFKRHPMSRRGWRKGPIR